ncbi:amidohydrolase family protein [Pseudodesulfovibrio piezophilus]|uniref:Putative selenium metabolism protein SsnA n=1 Tax=Pseudodesulfovibrio piezophilus (strain DSM 21447 / JCM 15486 / C1TLV30) TaxID=1322246 RepID=M1WLT6_PSEP2|nr:amidohydrolase family protein [Pseudodesulfovibrio piezophilus]CCH48425.1 putative selenium metabolism protein SsnA [Pseudodesulfovibrio piezophilus C1TLV30]
MKNLIINVSTYDFQELKTDCFVLFEEKILATGRMSELDGVLAEWGVSRNDCNQTDGKGGFLLPGLVAAHTHLYSTFARGWLTPFDPHSFQDVLDQLWWKLDRFLGKDEVTLSALVGAGEFLKNGVTTIIDHHASGKLIKGSLSALKQGAVTEGGLRALFCFETSDRFDLDECMEENASFHTLQKAEGTGLCGGLFGMHASFSLSDDSLKRIAAASDSAPVHVHVAESREDVDWTREECGKTIMERFDHFGLLQSGSLIAHGVHMEEREFEILQERGCFLVFNPTSNMNNGVGLPPVKQTVDLGIPWMIGNDGLGFGMTRDYQNLLFTYQLVHGPGSFQLGWLAESINWTYEYVNTLLGCQIGRLQKGFDADFFIIPYQPITPLCEDNMLGHFFFGLLDNLRPSFVWSRGEMRVAEGRLADEDVYKYDEAHNCARKLWNEISN